MLWGGLVLCDVAWVCSKKVGQEIQINTRHCFRMEFRATAAIFLILKPYPGCHVKVGEACEMSVDKAVRAWRMPQQTTGQCWQSDCSMDVDYARHQLVLCVIQQGTNRYIMRYLRGTKSARMFVLAWTLRGRRYLTVTPRQGMEALQ